MDTAIAGRTGFRRVGMRPLVILLVLVLLALAAVAVVSVGSRNRSAPPFGPARTAASCTATAATSTFATRSRASRASSSADPGSRAAPCSRSTASLSPTTTTRWGRSGHGRQRRRQCPARDARPPVQRHVGGLVTGQPINGARRQERRRSSHLWIAAADGSGAREVEVEGLGVLDATYNPADDGTLLVRAIDAPWTSTST